MDYSSVEKVASIYSMAMEKAAYEPDYAAQAMELRPHEQPWAPKMQRTQTTPASLATQADVAAHGNIYGGQEARMWDAPRPYHRPAHGPPMHSASPAEFARKPVPLGGGAKGHLLPFGHGVEQVAEHEPGMLQKGLSLLRRGLAPVAEHPAGLMRMV